MATRSGMCSWGGCTSHDTPIVVTSPGGMARTQRVRFCCAEHLACWAIKQFVKTPIANSIQERELERKVKEVAENGPTNPVS